MSEHLRLGLIGCGDFGKELGRYFQQTADIAALCDVSAEGMDATADALGIHVPRFADYRQLAALRRQIPGTTGEGFEDTVITESIDDGQSWTEPWQLTTYAQQPPDKFTAEVVRWHIRENA